MTGTNDELIQAVFTATEEATARALVILQGRAALSAIASAQADPSSVEVPLLMGMGDSAKLLGVSRATLWRMLRDGRLTKVEIYHNAFRLRRSDILALVNARTASQPPNFSSALSASLREKIPSSDRCPPSSATQGVPCG